MKTLIGLTSLALLFAAPVAAQDMEVSSPEEITEGLVGNTYVGGMGGAQYTSYFAEGGTYYDASGSGDYEVTEDGVCYPGTDFGCYAAAIDGDQLTWFQDGEAVGSGMIEDGDSMDLRVSE